MCSNREAGEMRVVQTRVVAAAGKSGSCLHIS